MLYFVLGLPCGFAERCGAAAAALARKAGGPTALIAADTLGAVAASFIEAGVAQAIVASRQPSGRLMAALVEAGRPFVLALDDPRAALIELALGRGASLADAVGAVAGSCAALLDCAELPGALVLRARRDRAVAGVPAAAIAHHLQIPFDNRELAALADELAAGAEAPPTLDGAGWWNRLAPEQRELATGALAAYLDRDAAGELSIVWAGGLFFVGDRPGERLAGPVDITGRARCLLYGPAIALPVGSWAMSLSLLFSREAAEHDFAVEVWAETQLASATLRPQGDGRVEVDLSFALDRLNERPISLRLNSLRAAFDGAVTLLEARLVRHPPAIDEAETTTGSPSP